MMPAGRVFPPLLLLLLLACTFHTRVHGQEVDESLVSTYYVEVTWIRTYSWLGVEDYNVSFVAEDSNDCLKTVHCTDVKCTFNSLPYCGVVSPCTNTTTTVTGGGYSAPPLSLVTGPEKVTNLAVHLEQGVTYISWVNPSMDSSPCYEETAVRVMLNNEDSISYFNHSQESTSQGLCVEGFGEVEVWAEGGDGYSNSSSEYFIYSGSEVVELVTLETCEPVGCTSLYVEWSYAPVCPDVEYLTVQVGDVWQNVSVFATNLTVTGLEIDKEYHTCVYATNKDGFPLQYSCENHCATSPQVPVNLTVLPLSTTDLYFAWDPPVCHKHKVLYQILVDFYYDTTTETEYTANDLTAFYKYDVELQVGQDYRDSDEVATVTAYTLPDSPFDLSASWRGDQVYVSWNFYTGYDWGFIFLYKVTWGKYLQQEEETIFQDLLIDEFNSTDDVYKVCVAAFPSSREDLMSDPSCTYVSGSGDDTKGSGLSAWAVAMIVFVVLAVVGLGVAGFGIHHNKSKAQQRHLRQQQQQLLQQQQEQQRQHHQRQQQDLNPSKYGATNPAPIT